MLLKIFFICLAIVAMVVNFVFSYRKARFHYETMVDDMLNAEDREVFDAYAEEAYKSRRIVWQAIKSSILVNLVAAFFVLWQVLA